MYPGRILYAPFAISVHGSFHQPSIEPGSFGPELRTLDSTEGPTAAPLQRSMKYPEVSSAPSHEEYKCKDDRIASNINFKNPNM